MDDAYTIIQTESRIETKVRGSRFIGESFLTSTVEVANDRLAKVRKREYQATHHCYAYRVGWSETLEFRYSDDGEPNGSAGRPIYDVISGGDLSNILVVVTRYFGGTKLGTGGLVRAYGDAARAVMEASGRCQQFITREYRFRLDFSHHNQWRRELRKLGATVVDSDFSDQVVLRVSVRRSRAELLIAAFVELTSGKGEVEEIPAQ